MSDRYDVIVVGVGGMGSTAAYHLAFRGAETLGLERFDIPNDQGSSHGITRIIRKGQYEDPEYVPLAERSYELWGELEDATGRDLLQVTGGIDAEPPDGNIFPSSRDSCRKHDITHKILTGEEVNERFPGYDLPAGHCAVYQPESEFLVPGQCIIAHVEAAQREGTKLRAREAVADVSTSGDGAVLFDAILNPDENFPRDLHTRLVTECLSGQGAFHGLGASADLFTDLVRCLGESVLWRSLGPEHERSGHLRPFFAAFLSLVPGSSA